MQYGIPSTYTIAGKPSFYLYFFNYCGELFKYLRQLKRLKFLKNH